jgi:hypothetical protein
MTAVNRIWQLLFGKPLDPLDPRTRHAIAVTPILAWVGLGADGLSSSCYGPEEAFLALGQHTQLALLLAFATAATVFIIALGSRPAEAATGSPRRCWDRAQDSCQAPRCWSITC